MSEKPLSETPLAGHEISSGVVADWTDHRDADFRPLSQLPPAPQLELGGYRNLADETWHQRGEECTGFALAAIANYLIRRRHDDATLPSVSRRMLYEMAQQYDGEKFTEGSTLRGALKGWSRVGVASDSEWPYAPNDEHGAIHGTLNLRRILDARSRPLMGYRRIKRNDVETMQRALAEGHPLYVAAKTHTGWYRLFLHDADDTITRRSDDTDRGIHAFVIIGYDEVGFLVHNSWGPEWGTDGYAVLPYDQWTWGATDTWVVNAGIDAATSSESTQPDATRAKANYRSLWQHLVVLDDHGQLAEDGLYEMDHGSVKTVLYLFDEYTRAHGWKDRTLAVIADGGEQSTAATIERLTSLRDRLLREHIYPIFVVWQTPWRDQLEHELSTWMLHRSGDELTLDVARQVAASESRARAIWDAVRSRSIQACISPTGGARLLAQSIAYKRSQRDFEVRAVSMGAGDIVLAPLASLLPTPIQDVVAIEPATTMHDFSVTYLPLLANGSLQTLSITPTTNDVVDLIAGVWSLEGSVMRQAGRDARITKKWEPSPTAVLGSKIDLTAHEAAKHLIDTKRLDMVTKRKNQSVENFIVSRLKAARATSTEISLGLPRDPLERAQVLHQTRSQG